MPKKTLFICTPSGKYVEWLYFDCLMKCIPSLVAKYNYAFLTASSSLIAENRNKIARDLVSFEENSPGVLIDFVLWIDNDMVFSFKDIEKIISHVEKGKDIVSGLYFNKKGNELVPVAYKKKGKGYEAIELNEKNKAELIEVDSAGFGFIAMKMNVIRKLNDSFGPRIFDNRFLEDGSVVSEDQVFCERAKKAGFKIMLDLAIKLKHVKGVIP